jgi:exodeoxyribonuclease III
MIRKRRKTSGSSAKASMADDVGGSTAAPSSTEAMGEATASSVEKKTKKKAPTHQQWTERTPLSRLWDPRSSTIAVSSSTSFTIVSWNVAGLRALIKNRPDAIPDLVRAHDVDVLCLQETKLQDGNMDDPKLKLREYFDMRMMDYDCHWNYSIEKKGYSGTAMFIRKRPGGGGDCGGVSKKQARLGAFFAPAKNSVPSDDGSGEKTKGGETNGTSSSSTGDGVSHLLRPIRVETDLGLPKHDGEGRTITAEFPLFYLTNVYVPNSGQKLDRLSYRTEEWDVDFLTRMRRLEEDGNKPVIWLGDLNVAHGAMDTWNEGAKHLAKSAGTTAEERASFDAQLGLGYVDAFRSLHPDARGHYTYWSQRAGNREPNKGLRLDYFICSAGLMEDGRDEPTRAFVRDSYMVPDELGSDHCPIVLVRTASDLLSEFCSFFSNFVSHNNRRTGDSFTRKSK